MDPLIIGLIGLGVCLALIALGVPIPISTAVVGLIGIAIVKGMEAAFAAASSFPFFHAANFTMSVVPLFILTGLLLFACGIGEEIFVALRQWLGHFPGGLAASTSAACAVMGTCTGSSIATTALMAKVAYPQMRHYKYAPSLSFGVVASSGTLASIIPPSVIVVIYGIIANQSIGDLLIAGLIPGFVSAAIYMVMIVIRAKINPRLGSALPPASWRTRFVSLRYLIPAVIVFITIVGGIYSGVFTATEAGGMAVVAVMAIVLITRRLTWSRFKDSLLETVRLTVMVMALIVCVSFFTRFLTYVGLTLAFSKLALQFPSPLITLALIFLVYLILGMFIDASGMMMIATPIFVPVIITLGYDPVWFGILVIKMNEVAMISPPLGGNVFIAQGIIGDKEITLEKAFKAIVPFIICDLITLCLFIAVPQIITFLPNMMHG